MIPHLNTAVYLFGRIAHEELAKVLKLSSGGPSITIQRVAPASNAMPGDLTYSVSGTVQLEGSCVITPLVPSHELASYILSPNPRLDFARALHRIATVERFLSGTGSPEIGLNCKVHETVSFGTNVVILNDVTIGAHAVIGNNVTIEDGCVIKPHAVIGEPGFGFVRDEHNVPIRLHHVGGVHLGQRVEIGSFTTVCRATLGMTSIDDDSKIDDHVHIAHNVRIGKRVLIAANAEISGSVVVENDVWVAPNACTKDNIWIGARAFIGLGAVVLRDVPPDLVMVGNPARSLEKRT